MRVVLLALLIALLPLRGWVGDAMAISMLPGLAAVQVSDDCPHAAASVGDEHEQHRGHAGSEPGADSHTEHGNAGAHLLCDVCNGPALEAEAPALMASEQPNGLRVAPSRRFASLAPRQLLEPPIA